DRRAALRPADALPRVRLVSTVAAPRLREVEVQALDAARLEPLIGPERMARFEEIAEATQALLAGRTVLNVNSTATGGGVAEMLQTLLAYGRGAGLDIRWLVIEGDPAFFAITKRIHNGLYGSPGDGGELGQAERRHYERVLRRNAEELLAFVRPGDVALIHDPQPAGLALALRGAGARVVWRCHVGADEPNQWTERSWSFLRPYLEDVDAFVFSRAPFAPAWADPRRTHVIPPSIDPFSAKNEPISHRNVGLILGYVGLLDGGDGAPAMPFTRRNGSPGRVNRRVDVLQTGPPPPADAPLVVQVSRWDRMKDMAGVMEGFARHVDPALGAHLLLCGPAVTGVADDPEAAAVLDECIALWRKLPHAVRSRVHLACTPMADADEAASIVNALQRRAAVVVQKSLAEGFGLTVAEAMWKARPIVASAVGGIVDQVVSGEHGVLVDDPLDLGAFGAAVEALLRDSAMAARLATSARARARKQFLGDRHLEQYGRLLRQLG
ncbi:MAG TPA: glycosyltransferase, partial [Gaiellaceae bacterium]|nr:glycosyltransferase [Gaiellaceae bacterium]